MTFDGWVIVGLGNPGPEYAATRHNVGAMVADELASRIGGSFKTHKPSRTSTVEGRLVGSRAVVARPRSFMNVSGGPVAALSKFYKVEPERLVVVHDELDLPYGDMRVKFGGGDNGHNGLKSIRQSIGSGEYYRVRFGIGRPPGRQDAADFVLKPFSAAERRDLAVHVARSADAVESLMTDGLETTQSRFNS